MSDQLNLNFELGPEDEGDNNEPLEQEDFITDPEANEMYREDSEQPPAERKPDPPADRIDPPPKPPETATVDNPRAPSINEDPVEARRRQREIEAATRRALAEERRRLRMEAERTARDLRRDFTQRQRSIQEYISDVRSAKTDRRIALAGLGASLGPMGFVGAAALENFVYKPQTDNSLDAARRAMHELQDAYRQGQYAEKDRLNYHLGNLDPSRVVEATVVDSAAAYEPPVPPPPPPNTQPNISPPPPPPPPANPPVGPPAPPSPPNPPQPPAPNPNNPNNPGPNNPGGPPVPPQGPPRPPGPPQGPTPPPALPNPNLPGIPGTGPLLAAGLIARAGEYIGDELDNSRNQIYQGVINTGKAAQQGDSTGAMKNAAHTITDAGFGPIKPLQWMNPEVDAIIGLLESIDSHIETMVNQAGAAMPESIQATVESDLTTMMNLMKNGAQSDEATAAIIRAQADLKQEMNNLLTKLLNVLGPFIEINIRILTQIIKGVETGVDAALVMAKVIASVPTPTLTYVISKILVELEKMNDEDAIDSDVLAQLKRFFEAPVHDVRDKRHIDRVMALNQARNRANP